MNTNQVWYVRRGSEVFGPAETLAVQEMLRAGRLSGSDEASATWDGPFAPISTFADLKPVRPFSEIALPTTAQEPAPAAPAMGTAPSPPQAGDAAEAASAPTPEPFALPADVRNKYLTALSRKGDGWVGFGAFVGSIMVMSLLAKAVGLQGGWTALIMVGLSLLVSGLAVDRYMASRSQSLAANSDKMLEVMYLEHERVLMTSRIVKGVGTVAVIAVILWWLFGTPEGERLRIGMSSKASCNLGAVFHRNEVFTHNGEFDAGFVVYSDIENTGQEGRIVVEARLTTSEGTLTRTQWETFKTGERRRVQVSFPEPSVAATNPSSSLSCSPAR